MYRNYRCITRGLNTDFTNKTPRCGLYNGAGNTPILRKYNGAGNTPILRNIKCLILNVHV